MKVSAREKSRRIKVHKARLDIRDTLNKEVNYLIHQLEIKHHLSRTWVLGKAFRASDIRAQLYYVLSEDGYSFKDLGRIFEKHHTTIAVACGKLVKRNQHTDPLVGYLQKTLQEMREKK